MRQNLIDNSKKILLDNVEFLIGDVNTILEMPKISAKIPFEEEIMEFLNALSKNLFNMKESKFYPDIITLGFWIRKASLVALKKKFVNESRDVILGRGIAFHIAPSNVPVNYAYSLVTGLLTGNANIVRIPSKAFPQVDIINKAVAKTLSDYEYLKPYICLIRYKRNKELNDIFSYLADTRIIWGGDATIEEIRKSQLNPRASEITFADRYSLAVIDSDMYMVLSDKKQFAEAFYNDTFLTDQNACTSPRIVIWYGKQKEQAKKIFWEYEHDLVKEKYTFQSIMGINKLTSSYLAAIILNGAKIEPSDDNYIKRVKVEKVEKNLMDLKDNSGYFFEYDCNDILEIKDLCNDVRCQTIGFLGDVNIVMPLLSSGIKGVDRIVPIGKTMDFDLIWDGYNLVEKLTRVIKVNC